ncbi:MAG: glycosyltransferase [candidate division NC10 bacterium]|nr:glycosyltransferase [candidate division NC10 bacterium]
MVSIVVPCRNEAGSIEGCLRSLASDSYPKNQLEILVVDGESHDGTQEVVERMARQHGFVRLLRNPKHNTATGMNIGIREAKGDIVMVVSAHAEYGEQYISRCVETLQKVGADCVGGPITTLPRADTPMARAIALAMSSPFGVGTAKFRTSQYHGYVDTVAFGAYRREIFQKVGLFDEKLIRNQDAELNYRILKAGGKIFMDPGICSTYRARETLSKLWQQYFQYGYWKLRVILKHGRPGSWRQVVPVLFASALIGLPVVGIFSSVALELWALMVIAYLGFSFSFSVKAMRNRGWRVALALPAAFFVLHSSYGIGFMWGMLDIGVLGVLREAAVRAIAHISKALG